MLFVRQNIEDVEIKLREDLDDAGPGGLDNFFKQTKQRKEQAKAQLNMRQADALNSTFLTNQNYGATNTTQGYVAARESTIGFAGPESEMFNQTGEPTIDVASMEPDFRATLGFSEDMAPAERKKIQQALEQARL